MNMPPSSGRRPALSQVGWTFGRGYLPFPLERDLMWDIISEIMDRKESGVMVLAHHNADLDAVATSLVLKWTFPWVRLGVFKSVSQPGKKLLNFFGIDMEIDPDLSEVSLLIIVDSSSPLQVIDGDPSQWPDYRVVDHHQDMSHWKGQNYIDDSKGACVEIALQMAMLTNSPLTSEMAIAGIAGIIADTGKYRFASPVDLEVTSFLLGGSETTMEDVMSVIEGEDYFDVSKKIAQLKAMKRIQYRKVADQVIATSRVNSFEAAACRTLLVAGADVAFVSAEKRDELRVSVRAKPHILKMGIHLGKFMEMIGNKTGNQGGGHDGAAGLNGKARSGEALSLCMREMADLLGEKLGIGKSSGRDSNRDERNRMSGRNGSKEKENIRSDHEYSPAG
jgi:nanoRNase/pAp phosphatase (c-di-AMP/oligoRNAs hydrolase)